jgi:hypothetical protein
MSPDHNREINPNVMTEQTTVVFAMKLKSNCIREILFTVQFRNLYAPGFSQYA